MEVTLDALKAYLAEHTPKCAPGGGYDWMEALFWEYLDQNYVPTEIIRSLFHNEKPGIDDQSIPGFREKRDKKMKRRDRRYVIYNNIITTGDQNCNGHISRKSMNGLLNLR